MSEAAEWLGKGKIWRHPKTGEIAGPVREAPTELSQIDRAFTWLVIAVAVLFVALVGHDYYHPDRRTPPMSAFVTTALPAMVIVGAILALVTMGVLAAYHSASLAVRAAVGVFVTGSLVASHGRPILIALAAVITGVAVAGRYYHQDAINDRLRARGFKQVEAKVKKDVTDAKGSLTLSAARSAYGQYLREQDKLPNDQRDPACRTGEPPAGYSGRWANTEYRKGVIWGFYIDELLPEYDWEKNSEGERRPTWTVGAPKFQPVEPDRTPEAPYGYVWTPGYGWTPRQDDPMRSPVPEPFTVGPQSTVHGDNPELPTDALRGAGVAHPMPGRKKP